MSSRRNHSALKVSLKQVTAAVLQSARRLHHWAQVLKTRLYWSYQANIMFVEVVLIHQQFKEIDNKVLFVGGLRIFAA